MTETERLLAQAIEFPPGPARTAFVEAETKGRPELRLELDRLLQIHDDSGSFLEGCAWEQDRTWLSEAVTTNVNSDLEALLSRLPPTEDGSGLGLLGPFVLVKLLGEGGSAFVFRALDTRLGREVAIKLLRPELAAQARQRQRFLSEAQTIASIREPRIIAVYEVGEFESLPYFVMEYLAEGSLQARLSRQGPLSLLDALTVAAQVLAGLQVAHARGLLHRDIKPSNVLIDRFPDNIKLSDFGLASSVLLEQEDRAIGTPQFSSPEQIRGEPIDQRTDLFGFGCFLYSLLVGRSPFAGSSRLQTIQMTLESQPEPLSHFGVAAPASLQSLLDRLLAKEREQRPRDAEEVSALLASIRQASSVAEPSSPSRRRWLWAAGGLALLSGLAYRYSGGSRGSRPLLPSRSPIKLRVVDGSLTPFLYSHDKATLVKSEPLALTKPIHYWRASSAGEAGTIIYRFEFSEPLKSCRLKAHLFCAFGFDEQAWAKLWIGPRMETMYQAVGFSLDRMEYWPVLGSKSSRPIMTLEDPMAVSGHPGWIDASAIIQGSRYLFLKAELFGSLDISSNAGISLGPAGAQFLREDPQRDEFSLSLEPSA